MQYIEYNTIEDAIYMGMENDVFFIIVNEMNENFRNFRTKNVYASTMEWIIDPKRKSWKRANSLGNMLVLSTGRGLYEMS